MSTDRYSTYDAKARFSELMRKVREGRTITITYHGEPLAELRPLRKVEGLEARVTWMRERGQVVGGEGGKRRLEPVAKRPGALGRFLEDRDA
jgi:prevent-host-death family protein